MDDSAGRPFELITVDRHTYIMVEGLANAENLTHAQLVRKAVSEYVHTKMAAGTPGHEDCDHD